MKFKELFGNNVQGAANLGMSRFRLSSDKEKTMSPHVIMGEVYNILETRPSIRSGLSNLCLFILNDIGIKSSDEKSTLFMQEWRKQRSTMDTEIHNFLISLLGVGTAYIQPTYKQRKNSGRVLDNIKTVPDSSLIYVNLDAKDDKAQDYWLMQVPIEVQEYDGKKPEYRPVWYIRGSRFYSKYIWCIPYPKETYVPMVYGHSRNLPHYGWGLLSTSVDDEDIQREIIKNWALQAKYRALGKKIIGFYNTSEESVSLSELEMIKEEFANLEEEDSIIVNKRFDQVDLSFNGQDASMEGQIDWLHKDSHSSLTPSYMGAFSQDSSMATAAEAKIPFGLKLKSIQPLIISFLNKVIIEPLKETYSFLADDLTFTLGTPELYSRDEVFNMMVQLYNSRACTFNELRQSAGLLPVKNGDVWGSEPPLDNTRVNVKVEDPALTERPTEALVEKYQDKTFKEAMKEARKVMHERSEPVIKYKMGKHNKAESVKEATKRLFS